MHALIIAGGIPPKKNLLEQEMALAQLHIGADSGGHVYLGYGHRPDIVVGDLDSFVYTRHKGIKLLELPDQETNDLEKSLKYALEKGAKTVCILGAMGKRFDHSLKNLSVLLRYLERFEDIRFKDNHGELFLVRSPYTPKLAVGTGISFFPVHSPIKNFSSKGVKYPLENSELTMGVQDGTLNEITSEEVFVHFDGILGVYIIKPIQ
jgi:thiamine pyrophosphokinase